jgi:glycosyltransferase involved in cell wall biosynthesis
MESLVSILIPAYNAEKWVGDTIASALAQTWPRTEIIVVDDGSTDQTLPVARRFASRQVKVISQTNQGASAARNTACSLCGGDYIQWLDADDLLAPDKIAKQMEALNGCSSKLRLFSGAWGRFGYRSSKASFVPTRLWQDLSPLEWLERKLEHDLFMQPATWLVSRALTDAAGPWDTRLSLDDDGEYFCRVVRASDGVRFVPEARVFYRRGLDTLSVPGHSPKKLESQFLALQLQISHVRSLDDSVRIRSACVKFLQYYALCFYPERLDLFEKLQQIAAQLGGRLELPRLSWKYAWIKTFFGWTAAKHAQIRYNRLKTSLVRSSDKFLFQLEKRKISNPW